MFSKENRYITNGVRRELPIEVILLIFNEIDELIVSEKEIDYLQVFNISVIDRDNGLIEIEHSQEVPLYKKSMFINNKEIKENIKVFVIDEESHSVMLLASEY
ncbi:TPA: DUF960 family protein [Clostridioides difficile]|uniref:DUF960 family protein n=1 Tax=Clostridioides difficile TaxID=1496 RepID=UPI00097FDE01|nr:DUF960 family protein [Clostridioides difficile]AXU29195.1 hypothetical protein CDIF102859_03532 [Clostridioides difficile]AXU32983.1 hypothetical protein CDIF102860_03547 [Clostridioides difficile]AXU36771.1 hypothetical protein CDIF102978_03547 [Clostridioides difficile]MCP8413125.1 DUF960 domain-containing protein [Clostridioides difficile]MDC9390860.1 DUF960 family protein [Clostridioides difficile]